MVTEHNISTMVMLSADKAWVYWEEGGEKRDASYGAIRVTMDNSEKLPSYVKREFTVYNTKVEARLPGPIAVHCQ